MCGCLETQGQLEGLLPPDVLLPDVPLPGPSDDIRPTQGHPIIRRWTEGPLQGKDVVEPAKWWLTPNWVTEITHNYPSFNARIEGIEDKPAFRGPVRYGRCVVPASAFHEWTGPRGARERWRFTRSDGAPLWFAGVSDWHDQSGLLSFAIITQPASEWMKHWHHREPALLTADMIDRWLDRRTDYREALAMLDPDVIELEATQISSAAPQGSLL
ncbi:MAG: hypothetical protein Alpg2KO_06010 [Alphaproteobacteria bacterium]